MWYTRLVKIKNGQGFHHAGKLNSLPGKINIDAFTIKWNASIIKGQKKARRLAQAGGGVMRDTSSQHVAIFIGEVLRAKCNSRVFSYFEHYISVRNGVRLLISPITASLRKACQSAWIGRHISHVANVCVASTTYRHACAGAVIWQPPVLSVNSNDSHLYRLLNCMASRYRSRGCV